jgi:hypothetical protein
MGNISLSILIFHKEIQSCVPKYDASYMIWKIKHPIQKPHADVVLYEVLRRIRDVIGLFS